MNFKTISIGLLFVTILLLIGCKTDEEKVTDAKRNAKSIKQYGPKVKIYEESKDYEFIYSDNGNDEKLSAIAADYLGRSFELFNLNENSKEFKPDYIEYKIEVDELPIDLKNISSLFSKNDRLLSKGKRENVVIEFTKKDDKSIRSQHTMLVDFPLLANSEEPTVTYGFDKKKGSSKQQLHIKKIKSADFKFSGSESSYFIGAKKPFRKHSLEIEYNTKLKKYSFKTEGAQDFIDLDRLSMIDEGNQNPLFDDMKYSAIISNIKTAQNKNIKSGGYYKVDGILRFLPSMKLEADFPLRNMYQGKALMRHKGTSLADGQSYVKIIIDDMQIGLLIDVKGYIYQYHQVIVDKVKGVIEKTVLIRT